MKTQDILGYFSIIGTNQDDSKNTYKGKLFLSLDDDRKIIAKWLINNTQEQFGTGFFKNNILVINFYYKSIEGNAFFFCQAKLCTFYNTPKTFFLFCFVFLVEAKINVYEPEDPSLYLMEQAEK